MLEKVFNADIKVVRYEDRTIICSNGEEYIRITADNFDLLCRSCLFGKATKNLFLCEHDGHPLSQIFLNVYATEVKETDGLPNSLCEKCFEAILEIYKFRTSVLKAEEILKYFVSKNQEISISYELKLKKYIETPLENKTALELEKDKDSAKNENDLHNCTDNFNGQEAENQKSSRIYKCKYCNLSFNKVSDYKNHGREEKEKRKDQFEECSKLIPKSEPHQEKFHKRVKPECTLQCETCGKKYSTRRNLRRHCLTHTGLPHVCELCGRGFRESHLLKEHLNIHSGVCPYLCSSCGKSYPTTSALRLHKRYKHEGKKPKIYSRKPSNTLKPKTKGSFPCEICGKVYASKTIVNYHVLTHSDEKKFQCNDCGKMFANKSTLGDHRRIHRLSYKCHFCSRSFAYAASLETHINSHTGDKPHACTVCGKRYSNRSHMREHMRNHSGERPYSCNICGKTFAVKGNLNTHLKTHNRNAGKNYICSSCPRVFSNEASVNEHIKLQHPNGSTTAPVGQNNKTVV